MKFVEYRAGKFIAVRFRGNGVCMPLTASMTILQRFKVLSWTLGLDGLQKDLIRFEQLPES